MTTRRSLMEASTGGPVRIAGVYPPPLVPGLAPAAHEDVLAAHANRPPTITRYDRARLYGRNKLDRSRAPQVWAGASACLTGAAVLAALVMPQSEPRHVRVDDPVAAISASDSPFLLDLQVAQAAPTVEEALAPQLPASEPVRVRIPALDVTTRVMELGLEEDGSMEVPPGAYPVGWYDGSPTPGQIGPAVLAGHVDWAGEPGAFYGLRELLPGDEVVIDRADGTTVVFAVDRVEEHAKDDFPTDDVYGDLTYSGLRLITCGGRFDEDSGDYIDNIVVFASLVAVD
ncbi:MULTISPECIES: class F sortase [unclassified Blastococcus]